MKSFKSLSLSLFMGLSLSTPHLSNASLWQSAKKTIADYAGTLASACAGAAGYYAYSQKPTTALGIAPIGIATLGALFLLSEYSYSWAYGNQYLKDMALIDAIDKNDAQATKEAVKNGANAHDPFTSLANFGKSTQGKITNHLIAKSSSYPGDAWEYHVNHARHNRKTEHNKGRSALIYARQEQKNNAADSLDQFLCTPAYISYKKSNG